MVYYEIVLQEKNAPGVLTPFRKGLKKNHRKVDVGVAKILTLILSSDLNLILIRTWAFFAFLNEYPALEFLEN